MTDIYVNVYRLNSAPHVHYTWAHRTKELAEKRKRIANTDMTYVCTRKLRIPD